MESVCMNLNLQSKIFRLTWTLFELCFCTTIVSFVCLILFFGITGCSSAVGSSTHSLKSPNISISPTSTVVGSVDLTLTVSGSGFSNEPHNKSVVVFSVNNSDTTLSTTFISSTQLTAVVPANLMVNPVIAEIFVETGDPMSSVPLLKESDKVAFTVTRTSGTLTISSVSPASALAGSPDLTITITGTGFVHESHDKTWVVFSANGNTNYLTTTFVSTTQVTAVIPAALMAGPVSGYIQAQTGDPLASFFTSTSNSIPFNIVSQ